MQNSPYPIPKAPPRHTDLANLGRWMPPHLLPYAQTLRLDRPAGYWLLLLPAWIAILLGSSALALWTLWTLALFFIGAVALRGAGCVVNDLWDRDLDRRVARTADRPLASGAISGRRALALIVALVGLGVLVLAFLPWRVWGLALLSVPLIVLYPLAKRVFPAPQLVLGVTFSWGALLGWLSVQVALAWPALWLYLGTVSWILYYDSLYATQDRRDDARLGLKSLPLLLGDWLVAGLWAFMALTLLCWGLALISSGAGVLSWTGLLLAGGLLAQQVHQFDADDPQTCLRQFQANVRFGQIWCGFLALDLVF